MPEVSYIHFYNIQLSIHVHVTMNSDLLQHAERYGKMGFVRYERIHVRSHGPMRKYEMRS